MDDSILSKLDMLSNISNDDLLDNYNNSASDIVNIGSYYQGFPFLYENIGMSTSVTMAGYINTAVTPNSIVEEFGQGGIGDCWYLAAIKALSISSLGQEYFQNILDINSYSASVTFLGTADFIYTTTVSAIASEATDVDYGNDSHSSGDADVILLEMALKSYIANPDKNSIFYSSPYTGGWASQAFSALTGKLAVKFDNWSNDLVSTSAKLDELATIIDHTAIAAACMIEANPSLDIVAKSHEYSIVAIDSINKTVSFRNPWYTSKVLQTISYADFSKYFQVIEYVDLTTNNVFLMAGNTGDTLNGNIGNDSLYGGIANDILNGGAGIDTMFGGTGDDTFYVDNNNDYICEYDVEGNDSVISSISYSLNTNFENLTLTGSDNLSAYGNSVANILTGNSGNNYITGYDGEDTLDGGTGTDSLVGGTGNDTYIIDSSDIIVEAASAGTDTVVSSISYTLGSNLENLTLQGTNSINGTGNSLSNTIIGNFGDNILNGGSSADKLFGGAGNDTYYVDNTGDTVTEYTNAGIDTVISSFTYTLGANLENLTLSGTSAINGTGNTFNNYLTGNSAVNTLTGGTGNDTLNGGTGADKLIGGTGDDVYFVDNSGDLITEYSSAGTDTVNSSLSYTLGSTLENLTLTGSSAINGTGNSVNNIITGNAANNTLTGYAGNDTLDGGLGNDTMRGGAGNDNYYVNSTGDLVTEYSGEGNDNVYSSISYTLGSNVEYLVLTGSSAINGTGNTLNNVISGNTGNNIINAGAGNDTISGGTGNDTLYGGAGNDTYNYYIGSANDIISDSAGTDLVKFGSGILKTSVAFFKQGSDLVFDYFGGNRTTIKGQSTSTTAIEKFQLSDGKFLTSSDINKVIQQMSSYASSNGIQLTSIDTVMSNQNLMTIISNAWHS